MERFLRGFGSAYRLHAVNNTQSAQRCLQEARYDVVLVDYRFSDGTVFDLLESSPAGAPVVLLTEEGQESTAALALKRGAYDYVIRDPARNYLVLLPGTIQKVLNRHRAEEALRQSEFRCRDLLDLMLDIYLCVSEDGAILLINRAGATQLGFSAAEMIGMPLERIVHPHDLDRLKESMMKASAVPDESYDAAFRLITRDHRILSAIAALRVQPEKERQITVIRLVCKELSSVNSPGLSHAVAGQVTNPHAKSLLAVRSEDVRSGTGMVCERSNHERVLIVDCSREQRALVARILAKFGYRVVTAENGRAAIALMRAGAEDRNPQKSPFDLVLFDADCENSTENVVAFLKNLTDSFPDQRYVLVSGGHINGQVQEIQKKDNG